MRRGGERQPELRARPRRAASDAADRAGGAAYFLRGNELHESISPDSRTFAIKSVQNAGNFVIEARASEKEPGRNLAGFSTNVPSEESDLAKVPAVEIERCSARMRS